MRLPKELFRKWLQYIKDSCLSHTRLPLGLRKQIKANKNIQVMRQGEELACKSTTSPLGFSSSGSSSAGFMFVGKVSGL